jgi:hypothetical protein
MTEAKERVELWPLAFLLCSGLKATTMCENNAGALKRLSSGGVARCTSSRITDAAGAAAGAEGSTNLSLLIDFCTNDMRCHGSTDPAPAVLWPPSSCLSDPLLSKMVLCNDSGLLNAEHLDTDELLMQAAKAKCT